MRLHFCSCNTHFYPQHASQHPMNHAYFRYPQYSTGSTCQTGYQTDSHCFASYLPSRNYTSSQAEMKLQQVLILRPPGGVCRVSQWKLACCLGYPCSERRPRYCSLENWLCFGDWLLYSWLPDCLRWSLSDLRTNQSYCFASS